MVEVMFSKSRIYIDQVIKSSDVITEWDRFKCKTFFLTGASGLIGTFLIDVIMYANEKHSLDIKVIAVGRSGENAKERFTDYWSNVDFTFIKQDVNFPIYTEIQCDYIIHGASNTHPAAYASDPIGTITANVTGTQNILEFAAKQRSPRVMFLSSVEVYGENRGDVDRFDESYCGYIDCNTVRAGYLESKRLGEALCQAYIRAKNLDIVIPRLSRVYGPSMQQNDSKAIAQFISKAVAKEDIILKSKGDQLYSYTYVADAATAIIFILLYGQNGEAYNISDKNSEITLKDLAEMLADIAGTRVVNEIPDAVEASGYSKATKAVLDNGKLAKLGWKSVYDIKTGLRSAVEVLQ